MNTNEAVDLLEQEGYICKRASNKTYEVLDPNGVVVGSATTSRDAWLEAVKPPAPVKAPIIEDGFIPPDRVKYQYTGVTRELLLSMKPGQSFSLEFTDKLHLRRLRVAMIILGRNAFNSKKLRRMVISRKVIEDGMGKVRFWVIDKEGEG